VSATECTWQNDDDNDDGSISIGKNFSSRIGMAVSENLPGVVTYLTSKGEVRKDAKKCTLCSLF
jgi:hypothetical protein